MSSKEKLKQLFQFVRGTFSGMFQRIKRSFKRAENKLTTIQSGKSKTKITIPVGKVHPEELTVKVQNGYLIVSSEKRHQVHQQGLPGRRTIRTYAAFQRMYLLPEGIGAHDVQARLSGNHLALTYPGQSERQQPAKRIAVQ